MTNLKVLKKLDLKLVKVIDTHIHADHISGLNELSKRTKCSKIMGEQSSSEVLDIRVKDNEKIILKALRGDSRSFAGYRQHSLWNRSTAALRRRPLSSRGARPLSYSHLRGTVDRNARG